MDLEFPTQYVFDGKVDLSKQYYWMLHNSRHFHRAIAEAHHHKLSREDTYLLAMSFMAWELWTIQQELIATAKRNNIAIDGI